MSWGKNTIIIRIIALTVVCKLCLSEFSVRTTTYGRVKGVVSNGAHNKKIEKFFGIPYARPPVGELRLEVSFFLPFRFRFICLYLCYLSINYLLNKKAF